ncbi:MAG: hypothetical protein L3J41_05565 [Melioribacteraceae bacterium]|nr:hypothetical protein [Melioribacteraceae bacterium]
MRKIFLIMLITFSYSIFAQSVDFSGYVRNYPGMLVGNGSNDFVILQNTFNLNIEKSFDNSSFKVNPMIYHNYSDSLYFRLREAYIDLYFDNFDLRVGKQQIVWGKADGVFITDIVSPKDLFEFLLPEFDEIRIGVEGAKFNYYVGNNTFEIVWLPVFTPTKFAAPNSVWAVTPTFPITPTFDRSKLRVQSSLENSELFLKYSALTEYIDYEIMGGYMWDDDPTMFSSFVPDSAGSMNLVISPEHKRLSLVGGSFSTTLGPLVVRGESAFYFGKYFNTNNPTINQGVVQKDYIHYMVGTDFNLFDVNFSMQFIQKVIMDYEDIIVSNQLFNGEYSNMMTFLARYSMLNETLDLELFSYYDFEFDDALIRPRMLYDFSDTINLQFGANIFTGTEGMFGQYNKNDMIYGKIIYSF